MIKTISILLVMMFSLVSTSGCSVVKASNAPAKKNMEVLRKGTPKSYVRASFGAPVSETTNKNGTESDSFSFAQGYNAGIRVVKVLLYTTADLFTLGFAEVITNPIETAANNREVSLVVNYDKEDKVESFFAIKGGSAIPKHVY